MIHWLKGRIIGNWLRHIQRWADDRIANGDMDFDDIVYRSRDATTTLLNIYFDKKGE